MLAHYQLIVFGGSWIKRRLQMVRLAELHNICCDVIMPIMMLCLFSQTFLANQNKTSYLNFLILLHNMFQPSGPDHMLNKTEWFLNCFRPLPSPESESQFKTKDTRIYNLKGPRDDQSPPQYLEKRPPLRGKIPLLRRPELLLAEKFSSSLAPLALRETKKPGHLHGLVW